MKWLAVYVLFIPAYVTISLRQRGVGQQAFEVASENGLSRWWVYFWFGVASLLWPLLFAKRLASHICYVCGDLRYANEHEVQDTALFAVLVTAMCAAV